MFYHQKYISKPIVCELSVFVVSYWILGLSLCGLVVLAIVIQYGLRYVS
jgi:hypothetical protein